MHTFYRTYTSQNKISPTFKNSRHRPTLIPTRENIWDWYHQFWNKQPLEFFKQTSRDCRVMFYSLSYVQQQRKETHQSYPTWCYRKISANVEKAFASSLGIPSQIKHNPDMFKQDSLTITRHRTKWEAKLHIKWQRKYMKHKHENRKS